MKQRMIVLVVHDVRSTHNVGSLLRTADGLGVKHVYFTGYTPYPEAPGDKRLPHIRARLTGQIRKTALGAENSIAWAHEPDVHDLLSRLKKEGFVTAALEQTPTSLALQDYHSNEPMALLVGSEVGGLEPEILRQTDIQLQIPMLGKKESFNVTVAAAMALYRLRYGA